jgi:hypothetical protein
VQSRPSLCAVRGVLCTVRRVVRVIAGSMYASTAARWWACHQDVTQVLASCVCVCAAGLPSLCGWCPFKATLKTKGHCVNIANRNADNKLCPITNNTILLQYVVHRCMWLQWVWMTWVPAALVSSLGTCTHAVRVSCLMMCGVCVRVLATGAGASAKSARPGVYPPPR